MVDVSIVRNRAGRKGGSPVRGGVGEVSTGVSRARSAGSRLSWRAAFRRQPYMDQVGRLLVELGADEEYSAR